MYQNVKILAKQLLYKIKALKPIGKIERQNFSSKIKAVKQLFKGRVFCVIKWRT